MMRYCLDGIQVMSVQEIRGKSDGTGERMLVM